MWIFLDLGDGFILVGLLLLKIMVMMKMTLTMVSMKMKTKILTSNQQSVCSLAPLATNSMMIAE